MEIEIEIEIEMEIEIEERKWEANVQLFQRQTCCKLR